MSVKLIIASILISGVNKRLSMVWETTSSNFALKSSYCDSKRVNPAAYLWPPNCSINSELASNAFYTSKPFTERAEAANLLPLLVKTNVGL